MVIVLPNCYPLYHKSGTRGMLSIGSRVSGSLTTSSQEVWYYFNVGSSGGYYTIQTEECSCDVYMELYGPGNSTTLVAENDDGGGSHNAKISQVLSYGSYYVKIRPYSTSDTTGTYFIQLSGFDFLATLSLNGSPTSGRIASAGKENWYKITVPSTAYYDIQTYGTTDVDLYLSRVSSPLSNYSYNTSIGNSKISCSLGAGEYVVKVKHHSTTGTGYYSVGFMNRSTALTVNGRPASGSIGAAGEEDWYNFVITSTAYYTIETYGSTDVDLYLYGPDNPHSSRSSDYSSGIGDNAKIKYYLKAGLYYVKVKHRTTSGTGSYTVGVMNSPTQLNVNGNVQSASIGNAGEEDWYNFIVTSAGYYTVQTYGATDVELYLSATNDPSRFIRSDNDGGTGKNAKISYSLSAGEYYVKVKHHTTTGTGSYTVGVMSKSDTLTINGTVKSGSIGSAGEEDWYDFTVMSSAYYDIQTYGATDVDLYVYGPNNPGHYRGSNSDSGIGKNAKITYSLSAGEYYVKAKHKTTTGTGSYTVGVVNKCTPLTINGQVTSASIGSAGEEDWYSFIVTSAAYYTVQTYGVTDVELYLYGPNNPGRSYTHDNDGGTGKNAKVTYSLSAGEWYVKVKHHSATGTGSYTVGVMSKSDTLTINSNVKSASISSAGEKDWYNFTVTSLASYVIETGGTTDVELYLYGPDNPGRFIASNNDGGAGSNAKIAHSLTPGEYYVQAKHHTTSGTGKYTVGVKNQPAPLKINDSPTSTDIKTEGEQDWYTFTVTNKDSYVIETGGGIDVDLTLYGPNSITRSLKSDTNSGVGTNAKIVYSLNPGEYFVKAFHHNSSGTGKYTIGVMNQSTVITINGDPVKGTIETQGDENWYKFTIPSKKSYRIEPKGQIGVDLSLSLYGPDNLGHLFHTVSGSNAKKDTTLDPGVYFLKIKHKDPNGIGSYTIEVDGQSTQLPVNTPPMSGSITAPGAENVYSFTVASKNHYIFETGGDTDVDLSLYGPNDLHHLICDDKSSGSGNNAKITRSLDPGNYLVKVKHHEATGTGDYRIAVKTPAFLTLNASPTSGNITLPGQGDIYEFSTTSTGHYVFETEGSLDVDMSLYGPDNINTLICHDENSGSGNNAKIPRTLQPGKYFVNVKHHSSSETGSYSIKVKTPAKLALNDKPISAVIASPGQGHFYQFSIASKGLYTVESKGQTDVSLFLYSPNNINTLICDDDSSGSGNNAKITRSLDPGVYFVKVTHQQSDGTGSYDIAVKTPVEVSVNAATPTSGGIKSPRGENLFNFTVTSGGQYTIETQGQTDVQMSLFGPDDDSMFICHDDNSGSGNNAQIFSVLTPGKYLVKVKHGVETGTGDYTISIKSPSAPAPSPIIQVKGIGGSTESGKSYIIKSQGTPNQVFTVLGGSAADGKTIIPFQYYATSEAQKWLITPDGILKSHLPGDWALDMILGYKVVLKPINPNSPTQKWHLTNDGQIKNLSNDFLLVWPKPNSPLFANTLGVINYVCKAGYEDKWIFQEV